MLDRRPKAVLSSEAAPNLVTFLAARSLPRAARPRILLREVASPSAARDGDPSPQGRLAYRLIGPVYRAADRVLVLAEGARDDLVRNFGVPARNIHVMRSNAVIDARTDARLNKAAFEHPRKRGLIVWVGRLSPEKDPLLAVEALSRLPASAGAHLQFVGDGAVSDAILARARELGVADKITMTGHAADPFQFLLAADVAVCTSRFEGFGNAIVEALACGTPVVATDCPWGPREILADGRYGTLVPVGDADAFAAAITHALGTPPDRAQLRQRAVRYATEAAAREFREILAGLD
jgi:glycosyltransferase involved in cell wall biosynthesis